MPLSPGFQQPPKERAHEAAPSLGNVEQPSVVCRDVSLKVGMSLSLDDLLVFGGQMRKGGTRAVLRPRLCV